MDSSSKGSAYAPSRLILKVVLPAAMLSAGLLVLAEPGPVGSLEADQDLAAHQLREDDFMEA